MKITAFNQLRVPGPITTEVSRPFWASAANGKFKIQHCDSCDHWVFYPRSHCPHCWSPKLNWLDASGRGCLKSFSVVHRPGHPGWLAVTPYIVALVKLDEGPTILTTLIDVDEGDLRIGTILEVALISIGDHTLPMFTKPERNFE